MKFKDLLILFFLGIFTFMLQATSIPNEQSALIVYSTNEQGGIISRIPENSPSTFSIDDNSETSDSIMVTPLITSDVVNIRLYCDDGDELSFSYDMFSIEGFHLLQGFFLEKELVLDLQSFRSGQYILNVRNESGLKKTFIIEFTSIKSLC